MTKKAPAPALVEFTFGRPWQHAGKDYIAGDTIEVRPDVAEKLNALKASAKLPKESADAETPVA